MSSFAEYERAQIGERTKAALAAKKRRGERLGRPGSRSRVWSGGSSWTATPANIRTHRSRTKCGGHSQPAR